MSHPKDLQSSTAAHRLDPGSIVRCRNRDWVLLPSEMLDVHLLRPLTGATDEIVAVHKQLTNLIRYDLPEERVRSATFLLPSPDDLSDAASAHLLWQAARLTLPNLKHLWSDLKVLNGAAGNGYILRIRCDWQTVIDPPAERHLEFGLALSNDRLFLKRTASNLAAGDAVPRMAYLPPFAGIGPREERMSPATRKRWMGRGLAGAVRRNLLYDFWRQNCDQREKAKGPKG